MQRVLRFLLPILAMMCSDQNLAANWPVEFRTGIFHVHADYDPSALRQPDVANSLANLPQEVTNALGIQIQAQEVHLMLFDRAGDYRTYMAKHFPGIAPRQAMFIRRGGPGMVFAFNSSQLAVDLRHESTHAMLNASLPYVPLWMDEGLAEYFEPPEHERLTGHPHQASVTRRLRSARPPEIVDLENIDTLAKMDSESYRHAWSIIHFLIHESDESRQVLRRFLGDLQVHSPPGQFSRRLEAELPDWRTRFARHFKRPLGKGSDPRPNSVANQ